LREGQEATVLQLPAEPGLRLRSKPNGEPHLWVDWSRRGHPICGGPPARTCI
jgi:hypothetical protein